MTYAITLRTTLTRGLLEDRLCRMTADGPFRAPALSHHGGGLWTATLRPTRPGMAIGFGKVAELLVLMSREFDVSGVERHALGSLAAAS